MNPVPYVDAAATLDANGQASVFILNRDLSKPRQVEIVWEDRAPARVLTSLVLTGDDLKAVNGFDAPERVKPHPLEKPPTAKDRTTIEVPPRSYALVQWAS
jgi:alpha-N-arabinofuranosidase